MNKADRGASEVTAAIFGLNDENWLRHSNPWSVWTRMAAFAVAMAAILLRGALGWWTLVPVGLCVVFMFVNTRVFPPVTNPERWDEKGIYGERLWSQKAPVAQPHRRAIAMIIAIAAAGIPILIWGLVTVQIWPTVFGWSLVFLSQLWQIDRFVAIFDAAMSDSDHAP